jgi:uncharacterized protein YqgV (UPF0045/DUF77 family)
MTVSAELSLYPLQDVYRPVVDQFIEALKEHPVTVMSGTMSTRVFGESPLVFEAIRTAFERVGGDGKTLSLSVRIINSDLNPAKAPFGAGSPHHH